MHLERGCLALAAWQSIADSSCLELSASTVLRAQCVAAGFGVRLDDDGSVSSAASAGISERVIEAAGRFGSRFARDQDRFTASMVANFQSDLGRGFQFESLSPSPNFRLTRCLYREIAVAGGAPGAQGVAPYNLFDDYPASKLRLTQVKHPSSHRPDSDLLDRAPSGSQQHLELRVRMGHG